MCTACRRNDYFGFSIILDCTEGLTKEHSLLRRLEGEGARRFCARGGGLALPALLLVPSAAFYHISWAYLSPE